MMNKKILCLGTILTYSGFAAGLEQLLTWSGENVGKANAVTSSVEGAEAIFFNPAGLKSNSADLANDISINASYLNSKVSAPVVTANSSVDANDGHHFVPAIFYSRNLDEKLSLGVGVFPSAGLKIEYGDQSVGGGVTGKALTDLQVIEFSAGAAYQFNSKLSAGLAYRVAYSRADFTVLGPPGSIAPGIGSVTSFKDLEGWDFFSFRGGVQFKEENWGVGVNVRTPIAAKVKGEMELRSAAFPTQTDDSASIATSLPLSVSVGGHFNLNEKWTLLADYTYLNYKANDDLAIDAVNNLNGQQLPNKKLAWRDGHVLRLGAEVDCHSFKVRGGYIIANSIVNPNYASPTVEAPGLGHLATIGGGIPFGENAHLDLSAFYGFAEDSASPAAGLPGATLAGDYKISGLGFHTGFGMKF